MNKVSLNNLELVNSGLGNLLFSKEKSKPIDLDYLKFYRKLLKWFLESKVYVIKKHFYYSTEEIRTIKAGIKQYPKEILKSIVTDTNDANFLEYFGNLFPEITDNQEVSNFEIVPVDTTVNEDSIIVGFFNFDNKVIFHSGTINLINIGQSDVINLHLVDSEDDEVVVFAAYNQELDSIEIDSNDLSKESEIKLGDLIRSKFANYDFFTPLVGNDSENIVQLYDVYKSYAEDEATVGYYRFGGLAGDIWVSKVSFPIVEFDLKEDDGSKIANASYNVDNTDMILTFTHYIDENRKSEIHNLLSNKLTEVDYAAFGYEEVTMKAELLSQFVHVDYYWETNNNYTVVGTANIANISTFVELKDAGDGEYAIRLGVGHKNIITGSYFIEGLKAELNFHNGMFNEVQQMEIQDNLVEFLEFVDFDEIN